MKENEIRLIKDLYKHYDKNQTVDEDFLDSLSKDYGSIRGILMNLILKFDPNVAVTDAYMDRKLLDYNISVVNPPNKESDGKKVVTEKKSSTKKIILWITLPIIILSLGAFIYFWFVNNSENDSELHVYDETPVLVNQQNSINNKETNDLTISSFRTTHNFNKLVLSQSGLTRTNYDLFSVNIKDGKFRINVRNTYDLTNSYVLSQVSENEFFTVSKKITLTSELLTLNKDLTVSPIAVDGQIGKFAQVTFSKGIKLNNIYESESYTHLINDYYMTYYLADLQINVGQPDETKYTIAISKENINRKQSSTWFYLNELNGWVISEFCDVNQLTTKSMAIINNSDGWSYVREDKARKASILFKLYGNQKFKILTNYGSWSLISYEGQTGFISNSAVQLIDNNNNNNNSFLENKKTEQQNLVFENITIKYEGFIAGKHPITIELRKENNEIQGRYYYNKHKTWINLNGYLNSENKWKLSESLEGEITGYIDFVTEQNGMILSGKWSDKDSAKELDFTAKQTD